MFKTKKQFIQAMLDGRKFKYEGVTYYFEEGDYPFQNIKAFYAFDQVKEVLPELEPFKPEPGDMINVWNTLGKKKPRKFICMAGNYYICDTDLDNDRPFIWKYAEPLPPKKPWIENDGKSFPKCKPGDVIESVDREGTVITDNADWFIWHWEDANYDIVKWRLVN